VRHNILLQPITNIFHYHLVRQLALFTSEKFDDIKSVTISRKSIRRNGQKTENKMAKRNKTKRTNKEEVNLLLRIYAGNMYG